MKKKLRNVFTIFLLLIGSSAFSSFFVLQVTAAEPDTFATSIDTKQAERIIIHLYFANKENSFLIAEKRLIVQPDSPVQMGKLIIESLIKGPKEKLMRTISSDAALRAIFVTKDKIAYVDLAKSTMENHPGGCKSEMITIYSIVNSLVLNIPEVDAVKILLGGRESMTLAGHIDLRFPLKADMLLVR
jgi:spore germination protein GerM